MAEYLYQVKVSLEDAETAAVTIASSIPLDKTQLHWFFQYMNDQMYENPPEGGYEPSVSVLCDRLNRTFPIFTFTLDTYDTEWCDNGPKVFCIPPVLTEEQYGLLNRMRNHLRPLRDHLILMHRIVMSCDSPDGPVRCTLRQGLEMIFTKHKQEILAYLKNSTSTMDRGRFFRLLDDFHIEYTPNDRFEAGYQH